MEMKRQVTKLVSAKSLPLGWFLAWRGCYPNQSETELRRSAPHTKYLSPCQHLSLIALVQNSVSVNILNQCGVI
jgi:hypothetical protein